MLQWGRNRSNPKQHLLLSTRLAQICLQMEWTDSKIVNLIEMYRERPVLWNSRLTDYKNRNKRHDAFLEISVSFGIDKDEIEKKIKYLLSHFSREIKKENNSSKSGASTSEIYKSKWFAYNSFLFLKDRNKPTGTQDTEGKRKLELQDEECEELEEDKENRENQDVDVECLQSELQSQKTFKSAKMDPVSPKRNKSTHLVNEAVNLMRSFTSSKIEKDEYTLFGEQIAIKIRKLTSPYAKFMVQNIINNTLFEAETGKFDNPHFVNPHYQSAQSYGFASPPPNAPYFMRMQSSNSDSMNRFTLSPCTSTQSESHYSDGYFLDNRETAARNEEAINKLLP